VISPWPANAADRRAPPVAASLYRLALRSAGAAALVAAETFVCTRWIPLNPTTVGFVYLVTVLLLASQWGLLEALTASVVSTLCFNYFFLPPVGKWSIDDPLNWIALFAFLITALSASHLSELAKRRTREALMRETEMERLYSLSRAILASDRERPIALQMARDLARIYELPFAALYDRTHDEVHQAGSEEAPELVAGLRDASLRGDFLRDESAQTIVMALSFGGQQVGSLGAKGLLLSDTALRALSSLLSLGIVNAGAQQAAARADAARQSEEFRSTLIDAVAHEFKTPLTSIKGAVSAVLSETVRSPEEQREMLEIIDEASDRLRGLVTEAIHLARIEANAIQLRREPHPIGTAISAALAQIQPLLEGRHVEISIDPDTPPVLVDVNLIQLVLRHLLDNAAKYSPAGSPIEVRTGREDNAVVVRIRNQGEGIPEWQRAKVFEKFYRGASARDIPGTGMGLAITREIVLAHGGTIRLESAPGEGAEVIVSLPVSKEPRA